MWELVKAFFMTPAVLAIGGLIVIGFMVGLAYSVVRDALGWLWRRRKARRLRKRVK